MDSFSVLLEKKGHTGLHAGQFSKFFIISARRQPAVDSFSSFVRKKGHTGLHAGQFFSFI